MKIVLLMLGFAAVVMSPARARLGETPDQLVARYGQPLNEADQKADGAKIPLASVTFQRGGFQVDVTITGGVSVEENYKKINGQPITLLEARTLLGANSGGFEWGAPQKSADAQAWTRDDGATALLYTDGTMKIRSRQLAVEEATAKKLEEKPSLEGF